MKTLSDSLMDNNIPKLYQNLNLALQIYCSVDKCDAKIAGSLAHAMHNEFLPTKR
jgi:hypothetical protein